MSNYDHEIPFSTQKYEKRLIVFIDLVGFKNFVLSNYGDGKEEVIKKLYSYFEEKMNEGAKYINKKGGVSYLPSFCFFSDTVIISYPLDLFDFPDKIVEQKAYPGIKLNMNNSTLLFAAQVDTSKIQLHALRHGLLTRGCITVGDVYHNGNTWFGPGIIDAYVHENEIAIYPRVILSKNAFDYFENEICYSPNSGFVQDTDGFYFVNYLSWLHSEMSKEDTENTILENIEGLKSKKKIKSLQKWEWFREYFNKTFYNDPSVIQIEKLQNHIETVSCGGIQIEHDRFAYYYLKVV